MVVPSNQEEKIAFVYHPGGQKSRTVNLIEKTCTCLFPQDTWIPCRHQIQACLHFHMNAEDLILDTLSLENLRSCYIGNGGQNPYVLMILQQLTRRLFAPQQVTNPLVGGGLRGL